MQPRLAPAKINLYLHVAAPDARGCHPLRSLVAFADIGDEVELLPGGRGRLHIQGPYADGLSAGEDNLIMKAVRAFETETGRRGNWDYRLTKNLPLASGVGGGSADAGAVLRLLRGWRSDMTDDTLSAIAAKTGADGVMCLWSRACVAEGYGEKLSPVVLPPLPCVLMNPGVDCPTPQVFRAFDEVGIYRPVYSRWHGEGILPHGSLSGLKSLLSPDHGGLIVEDVVNYLTTTRNDLEAAAIVLRPVIADVLKALRAQPETRLARMSGSGATCFALCASDKDAIALSARMRALWASAWVRSCCLS